MQLCHRVRILGKTIVFLVCQCVVSNVFSSFSGYCPFSCVSSSCVFAFCVFVTPVCLFLLTHQCSPRFSNFQSDVSVFCLCFLCVLVGFAILASRRNKACISRSVTHAYIFGLGSSLFKLVQSLRSRLPSTYLVTSSISLSSTAHV